jgi:hypothetical protein
MRFQRVRGCLSQPKSILQPEMRLVRITTPLLLGMVKGEDKNPRQIGGNASPHRTHHTLPRLIFPNAFMSEHDKPYWISWANRKSSLRYLLLQ